MEKSCFRMALSIFVVLLFLFGIFNIYIAQQYPRRVTGLYFFLDLIEGPGNMCMSLWLVVAVLFIAVGITQLYHIPKKGQPLFNGDPEEDEFDVDDIEQ